tara:strand:+ start:1679 stop:1951 length:273 start_codon:yes stop_codon:yes gene_type:complete
MSLLIPSVLKDPSNKWIALTAAKILAKKIKRPEQNPIPKEIEELGETFLNSAVNAIVQEWVDGKTKKPFPRKTSLSVNHLYFQLQERKER